MAEEPPPAYSKIEAEENGTLIPHNDEETGENK